MLKGWILFEEVGRHRLLRIHPNMGFRHLLELSVRSLKLEVCVEACCCEWRMKLSADSASFNLEMRLAGKRRHLPLYSPQHSVFIKNAEILLTGSSLLTLIMLP